MKCYVYFLFSSKAGKYYVGISNNIDDRLHRHNNAESLSTKYGVPWKLIHVIECESKSEALILEKKIKGRGISRYLFDNNIKFG